MTVQSARIQQVVKGDDVVLLHQIMKDIAYNAEASRSPDALNAGDVVDFFYPLQDTTVTDLVGYRGTAVGSYPTSTFNVSVPGVIPAGVNTLQRGTSTWEAGAGRTVRAEIVRLKASFTADTALDSVTLLNVSSLTGLAVGQLITGAGIPARTLIKNITSPSTLVLTAAATATATGVSLTAGTKETQYMIDEVDVLARDFPDTLQSEQPLNLP